MSESIVDSLRKRTTAAQKKQARQATAAEQRANAERAEQEQRRREEVASYVATILPKEVSKIQDGANVAADNGSTSLNSEWTVRHDTTTESYKGHKIAADVVELETAKAVSLQQALVDHLTEVGFATTAYEKPVGYREEVPDYGQEFHKTGVLYGVTISWAE